MPENKTPIESLKHNETRPNIATEELRDWMPDEEGATKPKLYPRDPSLDPQLVWKGKDEQDAADLEVPTVPIYIQEEIKPQDIIEAVRFDAARVKAAKTGGNAFETPSLFGTDDLLPFEEKIEFMQHEESW